MSINTGLINELNSKNPSIKRGIFDFSSIWAPSAKTTEAKVTELASEYLNMDDNSEARSTPRISLSTVKTFVEPPLSYIGLNIAEFLRVPLLGGFNEREGGYAPN
jgi:hypothetical protein